MPTNFKKILFDFIHSFGQVFSEKVHVLDNSGPNANGQKFYRVWLQCGTCFEVASETDGHTVNIIWPGTIGVKNEVDVLAILTIYGYGPFSKK